MNMEQFNAQQYLELMLKDKKKHIQIIALFALTKKYSFENYEQILWFIKRNSKAAKELEIFELDKIKRTLEYLLQTVNYKVALETVSKFIMENISELKGEEPILILKNGERIYDTTRLRELEKLRRIKYVKNKWFEI